MSVRPKKYLGQHFLKSPDIANRIVEALPIADGADILEIGPGTGVLTELLIKKNINLNLIEIDPESVDFLEKRFKNSQIKIVSGDFLKIDPDSIFPGNYSIIGNFPYNISSQIFFKVLAERDKVDAMVCMIQKEVAKRVAEPPGSKVYGILSVLLQAFFDIEYLFTVNPGVFSPPPKVDSAVIRLIRNNVDFLDCDEKLFFRVVKQGFQNRRKTLRNALKPINLPEQIISDRVLDRRAETLSVAEYVSLTNKIQESWNK